MPPSLARCSAVRFGLIVGFIVSLRSCVHRGWAWLNHEIPNSLLNSATVRIRVATTLPACSRSLSAVIRKSAWLASAAARKGASLGSRGKSGAVGGLPTFTVRIASSPAQRSEGLLVQAELGPAQNLRVLG